MILERKLERVDYRARNAVSLLNRFDDVITSGCCSGSITTRKGNLIYFVPGLKREEEMFKLDGEVLSYEEAAFKLNKGLVEERAKISPLSEVYAYKESSISYKGPCLEFSKFSIPSFAIVPWERRKMNQNQELARRLDNLYIAYSRYGLERKPLHGIKFNDVISTRSVEELVQRQLDVERIWKDIVQICVSVRVVFY